MATPENNGRPVCIAVFGASGFVGATLAERLLAAKHYRVRAFIHSTGNAARLARHGIELCCVDLPNPGQLQEPLTGCTHVVNCSRGPNEVMIKGLRNLLRACRAANVQRFVHLSSVAVYGDPPPPESVHEEAPTTPAKGTYGWVKLRQDEMVQGACRAGLPSVILCPPNISGPHSPFLLSLLESMARGELALVDGGETPCVLADVHNLVQAIELALFCEQADGRRLFITDDDDTAWCDLAEALAPLAGFDPPFPSITAQEARRIVGSDSTPRLSLRRGVKHLTASMLSAEMRGKLCQDPLLLKTYQAVRACTAQLPKRVEDRLKNWLTDGPPIPRFNPKPRVEGKLCRLQLRGVRHSCRRAREVLGYSPQYTFAASMEVFRKWYAATHGWGSDTWSLARVLQFG